MNPEEICGSRNKNWGNGSGAASCNEWQESHIPLCGGVDRATTSSVFHRLYTVGVLSMATPPKKDGKPNSLHTQEDHTLLPDPFYDINGSTEKSPDVLTRLFTAVVDFMMESPNHLCVPQEMDKKKGDSSSTLRRQGEAQEIGTVNVAGDLNWDIPDLFQRENVMPMVQQSEKKIRARERPRKATNCKSEQKGKANRRNSRKRAVPLKTDVITDSEDEYSLDPVEYLSFASPSFREIDTLHVMRKAYQSHFLDDNDNSTTSSSWLEYNRNSAATGKFVLGPNKKGAKFNDVADSTMVPLTISSDEGVSEDETAAIERAVALKLEVGKAKIKSADHNILFNDHSKLNILAPSPVSGKNQRCLSEKPNELCSLCFKQKQSSGRPRTLESEEECDCNHIFPVGSSKTATQRQIEKRNHKKSMTSPVPFQDAEIAPPYLQCGRATIWESQGKPQAALLGRQREEQEIQLSAQSHGHRLPGPSFRASSHFFNGDSHGTQYNQESNSATVERHGWEEELKLEEFLTSPISKTMRISSHCNYPCTQNVVQQ